MNLDHKEYLISLFNLGVLTTESANWYISRGYAIICRAGRVVDIVCDVCA